MEKIRFKINVREIGFGFIITVENSNDIEMDERFCEDKDSIIGQMRTWVDKIFEKKEE